MEFSKVYNLNSKRLFAVLLSLIIFMGIFPMHTIAAETNSVTVSYNVNFPTGSTYFYGNSYPSSPTLIGTDSTTISDSISQNNTASVRDVSNRMPIGNGSSHNAKFHIAIYFLGWLSETNELIEPGTVLTWDDLQYYDSNGDGTVRLNGQWSSNKAQTANFCVRYDSKTNQSDTSTYKYTPSVYTAYVGGGGDISLNGTTDAEAYAVDQQIRALRGNYGGDVWFYKFPSDAEIFTALKSYVSSLTVEDEAVNAEDLNDTNYAIRWYMIKYDGGDGWHIDGRLVKKKGQITVSKEFHGDDAAISSAKNSFYILATNGTVNENGVFTAYSSGDAKFKQHVLVLTQEMRASLSNVYPNASFQVYDANISRSSDDAYKWVVDGVELHERWQITEFSEDVDGYSRYSEYSVYDTDGNVNALSKHGMVADVTGKIFALDGNANQGLQVDFRNYYYLENSIFVKKEDGTTGLSLSGAAFEFWQKNTNNEFVQLLFSYDNATGQYFYDVNGSVSRLTLNDDNFLTISTTGFSYDYGDITVKEIAAPTGYNAAPHVTIGTRDGTTSIVGMAYANGTPINADSWATFAELEETGKVLIVKNYSSTTASLSVNKIWSDNITEDSVVVTLYANNAIATSVFPNMSDFQVTLNAAQGWSHTWSNLPTYANGSPVEWSVKETKIGDELPLSDGVSFANWTVMYSPATKVDKDRDGIVDSWSYTITNTVRRTQLFLTKTNLSGTKYLEGAKFTLVHVVWKNNTWLPADGAVTYTGTSDVNGLIHFDNLVAGAFYQLTETSPPNGCIAPQESIVLVLDGGGRVMKATNGVAENGALSGEYHNYTSPYNISVKNILQYNWSVSAPDKMEFSYSDTVTTIWNPETMEYETKTIETWNGSKPISVTNLSDVSIYLAVKAELIFPDGHGFENVLVELLTSDSGFEVTRTGDYVVATGLLAQNKTCTFTLKMSGILQSSSSQPLIQIGELSIQFLSSLDG